jgi:hypothetical protein
MPYATGTATSMSSLLTALRSACTSNGWTLAGNVLYKNGCYAEIFAGPAFSTATADMHLRIRAGNGIDGANALTDPAPEYSSIGYLYSANTTGASIIAWDWPVTYHVHMHGDEVHMFVNFFAGQKWHFMAFGRSPAPGSVGTGNWHTATISRNSSGGFLIYGGNEGIFQVDGNGSSAGWGGGYFWGRNSTFQVLTSSYMHGAFIESTGLPRWNIGLGAAWSTYAEGAISASVCAMPLMAYSPNAWNSQSILLPIQIANLRLSSKISLIGELAHARFCRNDFIDPGAVITLGADRWKVYPMWEKNTSVRDGVVRGTHSGTLAIAVRYDGP